MIFRLTTGYENGIFDLRWPPLPKGVDDSSPAWSEAECWDCRPITCCAL